MKFGPDGEKKNDVMLFESFPLVSHLATQVYVNDNVGANRPRPNLSQKWASHLDNGKSLDWETHARPPTENAASVVAYPRLHAGDLVFDLEPDLVGRFETEEIVITNQVVVQGQKLSSGLV